MVKFIETKWNGVFPGAGVVGRERGVRFNRYWFLSWQEEKIGACLHNNVNTLQSTVPTLRNG